MSSPATGIRSQWTEPSDIFSVLLILGGDVIQLALASLAGGILTPVAFSFGWVAYAISALLSAVGENRLVRCPPEIALVAVNLKSGYSRMNQSWLLARLLKTYDYWMPTDVRRMLQDPGALKDEEEGGALGKTAQTQDGGHVGLCVAVYRWSETRKPGVPAHDWIWWSGLFVTAIQLGVSAIPWGLHKDWSIFLMTACGTVLSYASGSLPQWHKEKWYARNQKKDVALTMGNGSQHVIIILGAEGALNLEDLASGRSPNLMSTRVSTLVLAILWLVLLITSTGIKMNTWYLLAVGSLGMLHNLVVAGAPRYPEALGLPIELVRSTSTATGRDVPLIFAEEKVMWTLMELEEKYNNYGKSLLKEFFPGILRGWEEKWWALEDSVERRKLLRQAQRENCARRRHVF